MGKKRLIRVMRGGQRNLRVKVNPGDRPGGARMCVPRREGCNMG